MTSLNKHLEQIELCASTIAELPFPPPRIFTNALLHTHDITSLIRDTEPHERALFSITPAAQSSAGDARRATIFPTGPDNNHANEPSTGTFKPPRRNTAVAAVLGANMAERIRRARGEGPSRKSIAPGRRPAELDVELLLQGAERLCAAYPMKGVPERIAALRARHAKVSASVRSYEALVAEQGVQLKEMNRGSMYSVGDEAEVEAGEEEAVDATTKDEETIRDLEKRKQVLEERVSGMERDLGGLMR